MAWALDIDGVVWLAGQAIPGSVEAVARLQSSGDVLFVTNNSSQPVGHYEDALEAIGIDAAGAVVTSAAAVATLVEPGERVLLCAGPGVEEALADRGVDVVSHGDADAVVVGWHRTFDFERMATASRAVHRGARLLATNDDATYPTPEGLLPGCGAILSSVVTATGATPTIAGKPYPPMVELVRGRLGATGYMVGDRPDTDGRFARALGYDFVLVLTGVTGVDDGPFDPEPIMVAADLLGAVARLDLGASVL
jgi:HAD superfamily hydrolase (TIGR01450 family)